ncbi:shikimate dehydrogenase [Candidatus Peregrinibacteria bacterium]|nr:shikimate dehydrogenase [Candidatus Peregrinibacteria bacterium]
MTKNFGILAYPAKHSLSPVMHNAAFRELNIDAQFGVFEISENEFSDFIERVKHEPISGLAVSLPYKENIVFQLNKVGGDAKKIAAVNTVVNKGGFLYGYNTDFIGSNMALNEVEPDLKDKKVTILGAGGASRAICYGLLKEGAKVSIYNRTKKRAENLAKEFSKMFETEVKSGDLKEIVKCEKGDILIQASSIWLTSSKIDAELQIPAGLVEKFDTIMDIVYSPLITPLLKTAKKLNKRVITGDKMLLYQAVSQFELFTNEKAPIKLMQKVLRENIH